MISALRGLTLGGLLTDAAAHTAIDDLADLPIERWQMTSALQHGVLDHMHNMTAYDAAYVALAEALGARLATRDRKLAKAAQPHVGVKIC